MIYIQADAGDALLARLREMFPLSAMLCYEQIEPNDAFGRVMCENLRRRGCDLQSYARYPSLETQRQRYKTAGW